MHWRSLSRSKSEPWLDRPPLAFEATGGRLLARCWKGAIGQDPSRGPQVERPLERLLQLDCCRSVHAVSDVSNFHSSPFP